MRYAQTGPNRIPATPDAPPAHCPTCHAPVIARCGEIITWHWAHRTRDCDPWAEPDSTWHHTWQNTVPPERREVPIHNHRADIYTSDGRVVELQHSNISTDHIRQREHAYRPRMIWIFDAIEPWVKGRLALNLKTKNIYTFRWRYPRMSVRYCRRPVFLDLGYAILRLKKLHPDAPHGGWGRLFTPDEMVAALNNEPYPTTEGRCSACREHTTRLYTDLQRGAFCEICIHTLNANRYIEDGWDPRTTGTDP